MWNCCGLTRIKLQILVWRCCGLIDLFTKIKVVLVLIIWAIASGNNRHWSSWQWPSTPVWGMFALPFTADLSVVQVLLTSVVHQDSCWQEAKVWIEGGKSEQRSLSRSREFSSSIVDCSKFVHCLVTYTIQESFWYFLFLNNFSNLE